MGWNDGRSGAHTGPSADAGCMAEPGHQTRLGKTALRIWFSDLRPRGSRRQADRAHLCARRRLQRPLRKVRIELNQRDIRRIAQRSCGRRVCLPRPTESAPSRTAFLLCPPTSPSWKAFCRHTGPGHVRYLAGPYGGPIASVVAKGGRGGGSYGRSLVLLGPSRVQEFPKLLAGIIAPSNARDDAEPGFDAPGYRPGKCRAPVQD